MCVGMRREVVEPVFKTPEVSRGEIGRVEVSADKATDTARIFWASGMTVNGITGKGKEFLRFNTNLAEPIRSMHVIGEEIHTGGEFIYNQFVNCKEAEFFMAGDRINDLTCSFISDAKKPDAVLACQDRHVRVLAGSNLVYEVPIDGPVTTVEHFDNSRQLGVQGLGFNSVPAEAPQSSETRPQMLYGTENGHVGQLFVEPNMMRRGFVIDPVLENRRGKAGGVWCICAEDITKDGAKDLLVGRDDGVVEVWSFENEAQPKLVFERSLQESVTSIQAGMATNSQFDEVVLSTYAGKVLAFSTEPSMNVDLPEGVPQEAPKKKTERKIRTLMSELEKLRTQVLKERERYSKVSQSLVASDVQLKLKDKWNLSPEEACYKLQLELTVPLEMVLLQSDVPVELVEADSNVAIVSRTPVDTGVGLLATYRCQEVTNRLELRVRTSEGRYGNLQVFVWPRIQPKTCRAASYAIKPLSLHTRIMDALKEAELPALNTLRITGPFSLAEAHSWVGACLPEVPVRFQVDEVSFAFKSSFLGTLLLCDYKKGEATFRSDSLTSLAIVKEVITKEATARKHKIHISIDAKDETITALLTRIDPLLKYQLSLNNRVALIEALKEVKMQEDDASFLAPQYLEILENEEKIIKEFKEQPGRLQFLHGIITDLFVDKYKFKGRNVAQEVPQLIRVLADYSLEAVIAFFNSR